MRILRVFLVLLTAGIAVCGCAQRSRPPSGDIPYYVTLVGHPRSDVDRIMRLGGGQYVRSYKSEKEFAAFKRTISPLTDKTLDGEVMQYHLGGDLGNGVLLVFLDHRGTVTAIHWAVDRF